MPIDRVFAVAFAFNLLVLTETIGSTDASGSLRDLAAVALPGILFTGSYLVAREARGELVVRGWRDVPGIVLAAVHVVAAVGFTCLTFLKLADHVWQGEPTTEQRAAVVAGALFVGLSLGYSARSWFKAPLESTHLE